MRAYRFCRLVFFSVHQRNYFRSSVEKNTRIAHFGTLLPHFCTQRTEISAPAAVF